MSGLKGIKHLDYAVYGNLIVPWLMHGTEVWFQTDSDRDAGKCRLECRLRGRGRIGAYIGGREPKAADVDHSALISIIEASGISWTEGGSKESNSFLNQKNDQ